MNQDVPFRVLISPMGAPGTWDLCLVKWPFGDHTDYCERDSEWLVELICKTCGRRPAVVCSLCLEDFDYQIERGELGCTENNIRHTVVEVPTARRIPGTGMG